MIKQSFITNVLSSEESVSEVQFWEIHDFCVAMQSATNSGNLPWKQAVFSRASASWLI